MNLKIDCPDPKSLQDLLDGMSTDREQTFLTRHLDDCPRCQQRLETLAVGGEPWPGVHRFERWKQPHEAALDRAMTCLFQEGAEGDGDGDPVLGFLRPSQRAGSLGAFGRYEVLEKLGSGGMGIVLKALDPDLNRVVAIKVLAPQLAASGAARQRFAREARAAAAVSHEHVVPIYDVDSASGLPYLVMQYVPGPTLQQRLDRDGALELEEVLRIGMQVASGLAAAHAQGVVHRDIKPANILLENGVERVRLTDFGLARAMDDATVTQSGYLPGTPAYMAPEQARGESFDHRADLFSLGSVLYAMCTGRAPFRASTLFALLRRVGEDAAPPVQDINPRTPDWLVTIMNRLHEKDPAKRYQSAGEVATLLGECLAHVRQPSRALLPEALRPRPVRPTRPRSLLFAAALIPILLLAAVVLRIRTPDGTLVIEVSDPAVQVSVDGKEVVITGAGIQEVRLKAGQYKVEATKDGKPVLTKIVDVKRDGREVVTVSLDPSPAAVAGGREGTKEPADPRAGPRKLDGHAGRIVGLTFSPDGKLLLSAAQDNTIRAWDSRTGKELFKSVGAKEAIVSLAVFADGKTVVTVGEKGTLQLWDAATGKLQATLKLSTTFKVGALDPTGRVLGAADDGTVRIWDATTGKEVRNLKGHTDAVKAIAFSPDGRLIASSEDQGTVRVWDFITGKQTRSLSVGEVKGIAFSPDGRRLVVTGGDSDKRGNIRIWDVASGEVILSIGNDPGVTVTANSPDGKLIASGTNDGKVAIIEVQTGKTVYSHFEEKQSITTLAFSPDGATLAWGTASGGVRLWEFSQAQKLGDRLQELQLLEDWLKARTQTLSLDERNRLMRQIDDLRAEVERLKKSAEETQKAERLARLKTEQEIYRSRIEAYERAYAAQIHAAQRELELNKSDIGKLLEDAAPELRGWEWKYLSQLARTRKPFTAIDAHKGDVLAVAFSPDGKHVASGGADGALRLWDGAGEKLSQVLVDHRGGVSSVAFRPDGKAVATVGNDGRLIVWSIPAGKVALSIGNGRQAADHPLVAFSPDGKTLAHTLFERQIHLLDATTGKELWRLAGLKGRIQSLVFSPDAARIAVVTEAKDVALWDVAAQKQVLRIAGTEGTIQALSLSPDGKILVASNDQGSVFAWGAADGDKLWVGKGHSRAVKAVAFSPDGRRVASVSEDGTLSIRDAATGTELLLLKTGDRKAQSLAFSPDGRQVIVGASDGALLVYPAGEGSK